MAREVAPDGAESAGVGRGVSSGRKAEVAGTEAVRSRESDVAGIEDVPSREPDVAGTEAGPGGASDRGSGTVWVIVMVALVAAIALSAAALGGAIVTRHRASAAADLSALAAADAVARAATDPCGTAARVAQQYGAELAGCMIHGSVVDVVVELTAGGLVGDGRAATVRARAGPS